MQEERRIQNEVRGRKVLAGVLAGVLLMAGGCSADPAGFRESPYAGALYINEFMASNRTTVADEAGDYDDWVEVHNAGDAAIRLRGMYLTDNLAAPTKWSFPDTTIGPGEYLLVWCDGEYREGPLHASFKLDSDGEQLGFFAATGDQVYYIDTLSFGPQSTDTAQGRYPDGGAWRMMDFPTPGARNISGLSRWRGKLFINEFQASNQSTVRDEAGDYDDWLELYNAADSAVALGGWTLTDDLGQPKKWTFPDTNIRAGGFLLVWCDDEPEQGPLHATFNLAAAAGEQLGLYSPEGRHALAVDTFSFGPQKTDTSFGRMPDGGADWQLMPRPTPGRSNAGRR